MGATVLAQHRPQQLNSNTIPPAVKEEPNRDAVQEAGTAATTAPAGGWLATSGTAIATNNGAATTGPDWQLNGAKTEPLTAIAAANGQLRSCSHTQHLPTVYRQRFCHRRELRLLVDALLMQPLHG